MSIGAAAQPVESREQRSISPGFTTLALVKSHGVHVRVLDPRLGPRAVGRPTVAPMSVTRAGLLSRLADRSDGCTVVELADATGLHQNTVRGHLEALAEDGLVARVREVPNRRGRPAFRYRSVPTPASEAGSEYAELAAALAEQLSRTSSHPQADAMRAGVQWGRRLAGQLRLDTGFDQSETTRHQAAAHQGVVTMLSRLRFEPSSPKGDRATIRLRTCPLLEAARRHPQIVCAVHLGLVRGALQAWGIETGGTELIPFAEPGGCVLHLAEGGNQSRGVT